MVISDKIQCMWFDAFATGVTKQMLSSCHTNFLDTIVAQYNTCFIVGIFEVFGQVLEWPIFIQLVVQACASLSWILFTC